MAVACAMLSTFGSICLVPSANAAAPSSALLGRSSDEPAPPAGDEGNAALVEDPAAAAAEPPAVPDARVDRLTRERAYILGLDPAAGDLRGAELSLYQGKWFVEKQEDTRRCIIERESHANYRASNGVYHGAYQMSAALADGAAWMMQKEVRREIGDEGVKIVQKLRSMTPNNWNRYWQDRAFWTIWRNGEGRHHWGGGISDC